MAGATASTALGVHTLVFPIVRPSFGLVERFLERLDISPRCTPITTPAHSHQVG